MASPLWNGTMKQPAWRSNALTRTATGSRCTGSHRAPDDAKSAGRALRENALSPDCLAAAAPPHLARWCLALADGQVPDGTHVHLDPGTVPLSTSAEPLLIGREDRLAI